MLSWITMGLGWFQSNMKWVVIAVAVTAVATLGLKLRSTLIEYGAAQAQIQQLQLSINQQKSIITGLEMQRRIDDAASEEYQRKIDELELQLEGITSNLGGDANDLAAESVRELLRRLK